MIEVCGESPNEAQQRSVPSYHEYGRAQWEEGLGSTILGRVNQGQRGHHRRGEIAEDDQAQKSKNWPMEEEREKQATISSKSHIRHPHG
jgi:hypothetical protein